MSISKINLGGYFSHYRDDFKRCNWAFVTSQESGTTMNLKELKEGAEQWMWRPAVKRGSDRGCWHMPGECHMNDAEMEENHGKSTPKILEESK